MFFLHNYQAYINSTEDNMTFIPINSLNPRVQPEEHQNQMKQ